MASFTAGTTFTDGVANDVTAAKLAALVNAATPTSGFIQDRTSESAIAADDTLLFGDFSDSNNLKRMTVANFNNVVTTGTGTAASPAIVPTGDSNTGIFFPAADTIAFSEGGAEAMRIDSNGDVGIGESSPTSKLEIATASTTAYGLISRTPVVGLTAGDYVNMAYFSDSRGDSNDGLRIVNIRDSTGTAIGDWPTSSFRIRRSVDQSNAASGVQEEIVFGSNLLAFHTAGTERLRIDSSGNVGIGTTSPAAKLDVYGTAHFQNIGVGKAGQTGNRDAIIDLTGDATYSDYGFRIIRQSTGPNADSILTARGTGNVILQSQEAGQVALSTSGIIRMTVNSSGNVGIGMSPSAQFEISTDSAKKPSTNTWTIASDQRLKTNITNADNDRCYEIVKQVPLKRYTWKNEVYSQEQVNDRSKLGWIAQDVEAVFPKAVGTNRFAYNQVFEDVVTPELDSDGNAVLDENGAAKTRTEKRLVSEEVIEDCKDLNSDQIYAAMYGTIQKLIEKVETLEAKVAALEAA